VILRLSGRRCHLDCPKVQLFAFLTGCAPEAPLPDTAWRTLLQILACIHHLMGANWGLLLRAWPSARGAPLPLPAVLDLLANLYNSETPTELPVRLSPPTSCHTLCLLDCGSQLLVCSAE
jgi:hypothetical protein